MFELSSLSIPGAYYLRSHRAEDARGSFVKTFHSDFFRGHGLNAEWREHYYSHSVPGVVRGMHFQLPPFDHEKLVFCVTGKVFDVVLDLRVGSPTFGKSCTLELSAQNNSLLYLPRGIAHGFFTTEAATLAYSVSSQYSSAHDAGVRFNSVEAEWPEDPIVSARDLAFPHFEDFLSPFVYQSENTKVHESK